MRLSNASTHAVHALTHLAAAGADCRVASHVIARACGLPEDYLLKVLRPLVSAQLLRSLKGPRGGYRLARPAARITLLEVVEAIGGPLRGEAPVVSQAREGLDARLRQVCEEVAGLVRRRLGRVRLSDLAGKR
jgi:Rrf2 family protein